MYLPEIFSYLIFKMEIFNFLYFVVYYNAKTILITINNLIFTLCDSIYISARANRSQAPLKRGQPREKHLFKLYGT